MRRPLLTREGSPGFQEKTGFVQQFQLPIAFCKDTQLTCFAELRLKALFLQFEI
jgi:hypothetical protein